MSTTTHDLIRVLRHAQTALKNLADEVDSRADYEAQDDPTWEAEETALDYAREVQKEIEQALSDAGHPVAGKDRPYDHYDSLRDYEDYMRGPDGE